VKFIINGFKDDNKIFWKRHIPCICNGIHDLKSCKHCKYQHRESLVPRESFTVQEPVHDKNMKIIKYETRTINEITVIRGSDDDLYMIRW